MDEIFIKIVSSVHKSIMDDYTNRVKNKQKMYDFLIKG